MALLASGLLPASFRGAPFAVTADEVGGGRRIALHQYPGRDVPWAEDMGRAARTFRFRAFIVDADVVFAGGPIQLQRTLLLAALEKQGSGLLTHPTLGPLTVSVVRFAMGSDLGANRMSTLDIEFVEAGKQSFPSLLSGGGGLFSAANLVRAGLAVDAIRTLALVSAAGDRRGAVVRNARAWSDEVDALGADATALHRLAAELPGEYGRFSGGGNVGLAGARASRFTAATSIDDLAALASDQRATIRAAAQHLVDVAAVADLSDVGGLPAAAGTLVNALAAACADPSDGIRLLAHLATFEPVSRDAIPAAFARLMSSSAVAALIETIAAYQPASSDDAAALIARVAPLLDDVAAAAAEAGDDETFNALRRARAAMVEDLRRRGATLARVATFTPGVALPSLRLAQRYYRDAARAPQLEGQAVPVHPLFMPVSFQALAA